MSRSIADVSLDNLHLLPEEVRGSVFWELDPDVGGVDPELHKEEWFSSTLLEWGPCGKVMVEDQRAVAFAQFAPAALFPRLASYRCGRVSTDALYLAYCYVVRKRRGRKLGTEMLRAVGRDAAGRGFRALESLGERTWQGGWVLPAAFLEANRFTVVRDDAEVPLLRLDLWEAAVPAEARRTAAAALPAT